MATTSWKTVLILRFPIVNQNLGLSRRRRGPVVTQMGALHASNPVSVTPVVIVQPANVHLVPNEMSTALWNREGTEHILAVQN